MKMSAQITLLLTVTAGFMGCGHSIESGPPSDAMKDAVRQYIRREVRRNMSYHQDITIQETKWHNVLVNKTGFTRKREELDAQGRPIPDAKVEERTFEKGTVAAVRLEYTASTLGDGVKDSGDYVFKVVGGNEVTEKIPYAEWKRFGSDLYVDPAELSTGP